MKELGALTSLRVVYIGVGSQRYPIETSVTDDGIKHLARLKNLEYLTISGPKITDESIKVLAGLNHLKNVGIKSGAVSDAGLEELRKAVPGAIVHR
jgi:hypothetical protein